MMHVPVMHVPLCPRPSAVDLLMIDEYWVVIDEY